MRVEKKAVSHGTLRVSTVTDEVEDLVRVALDTDEVEIARVPIGRRVDAAPPVRTEGEVTIIPVLEEVLHVEKRLVLAEEIHLRRRVRTKTLEQPVTRRRQRAVVEKRPPTHPRDEADHDV